ncbi:hypothetical protein [Streptomyces sp. NPDC014006]|uniref:hypothetical protein n=1 Tax=Streptomyces sp. NPDC014006 TaxID=3364870 RepID=UPI0036F4EE76
MVSAVAVVVAPGVVVDEAGELKVEPARRIGRLPKAEQKAEAEKAINAVKTPRQRRRQPEGEGAGAPTVNGVNTPEGPAGPSSEGSATVNGVNTQAEGSPAVTPATWEASGQGEGEQPRRLPYDDALYVVRHLHLKMATEHFVQGARVWMKILREKHPEEYQALLIELRQQEQQPA